MKELFTRISRGTGIILVLLAVVVSFLACGEGEKKAGRVEALKTPEEMLCRRWSLEKESIGSENFKTAGKGYYMLLKPDGMLESKDIIGDNPGSWKLTADKKTVTLNLALAGGPVSYRITELTDQRLVLDGIDSQPDKMHLEYSAMN